MTAVCNSSFVCCFAAWAGPDWVRAAAGNQLLPACAEPVHWALTNSGVYSQPAEVPCCCSLPQGWRGARRGGAA